ncbi:FxDxF family PEP-CTERM protein [Sphingomonas sp. RS2018]
MKKIVLSAAIAASALAFAPAASAATYIFTNPGANGFATYTFGNNDVGTAATFDDTIVFTTPSSGFLSLSLSEVAANAINNVEFTTVTLNGTAVTLFSGPGGEPDFGSLMGLFNAGTSNTLRVIGTNGGNGVYSGTIAFAPGAVPEPATWGLMMLGFGGMGFAMRRRRKVETRIRFA